MIFFQFKLCAMNQPELYRPVENDDDDAGAANITAKEIEQEAKEVSHEELLIALESFLMMKFSVLLV